MFSTIVFLKLEFFFPYYSALVIQRFTLCFFLIPMKLVQYSSAFGRIPVSLLFRYNELLESRNTAVFLYWQGLSLSLKCDPQSSMSLSPTSISPTLNQRLKLKIIINSCLKREILDSTKDVLCLFL